MLWSVLALQLPAIFTTWSKLEVYLNHTPYFHTEMLAIILKWFSILYRCYYSQNYSGIIISGLIMGAVCLQRLVQYVHNVRPGQQLLWFMVTRSQAFTGSRLGLLAEGLEQGHYCGHDAVHVWTLWCNHIHILILIRDRSKGGNEWTRPATKYVNVLVMN